jgi:hypothetical protein
MTWHQDWDPNEPDGGWPMLLACGLWVVAPFVIIWFVVQ